MSKLRNWIGRIPWWVWLFLAVTQVLTLVAAPFRLAEGERVLRRLPDHPAYVEMRARFEKYQRDEQIQFICATVLGPLFLGAAIWRWSSGRARSGQTVEPALQKAD
jgi:hypothetical protein